MRRNSRYPTRSTVNRPQNTGGVGGSSISNSVPERRTSDRTRSQTDRYVSAPISSTSTNHHPQHQMQNYSRLNQQHQQHGQHVQAPNPFQMYQSHQMQNRHVIPNGTVCSVQPNITITTHTVPNNSVQYRPPYHVTTFNMPRLNDINMLRNDTKFMKLNSYDDVKVLIKTRTISN